MFLSRIKKILIILPTLNEVNNIKHLFNLLKKLKLDNKKVAIELNRVILPKNLYKKKKIKNNDIIEIVHFIGGG